MRLLKYEDLPVAGHPRPADFRSVSRARACTTRDSAADRARSRRGRLGQRPVRRGVDTLSRRSAPRLLVDARPVSRRDTARAPQRLRYVDRAVSQILNTEAGRRRRSTRPRAVARVERPLWRGDRHLRQSAGRESRQSRRFPPRVSDPGVERGARQGDCSIRPVARGSSSRYRGLERAGKDLEMERTTRFGVRVLASCRRGRSAQCQRARRSRLGRSAGGAKLRANAGEHERQRSQSHDDVRHPRRPNGSVALPRASRRELPDSDPRVAARGGRHTAEQNELDVAR